MLLKKLSLEEREKEINRLKEVKDKFMAEYTDLCKKWEAQLVPVITPLDDDGKFHLQFSIDVYKPIEITKEQVEELNKITKE
jgi:hypothetical protein